MELVNEMIKNYPADLDGIDQEKLARCIRECLSCAQACTACADACLGEEDVAALVNCVRTNLDCADICFATGQVLSRHTGYDAAITRGMLEVCATACRACAELCEGHAAMEHCAQCAQECRICEQVCRELLATLG
ncbi:four-helix bundle copper-binding protein [Glycomyces terrestris]|uniref:Four-helix bundle copper-binding protein n=1 Tax=Glycomyces terrestris TaxID=2493553 RepID=A0A426UXI8_9ACTN|nr:four-helix bundle copper-binding protein [Glycomyces terrestris]RRR99287.1 four-helix bundle copper-binding protein [Glycomyces terrestris]